MNLDDVIALILWVEKNKEALVGIRSKHLKGYQQAVDILCAYDALKAALFIIKEHKEFYEKRIKENA